MAADPVLATCAGRRGDDAGRMLAAAAGIDPVALLERHRALGVEVLVHGHRGYPARLVGDPSPPPLLFVSGDLAGVDGPTVAIVGTRNATRLGCDTAGELATDLARSGVGIVSGLALGIDGAAHAALVGALDRAGEPSRVGRPVAVVAAGLDRRYPRAHASLHRDVVRWGAVVGEVPLGVGPSRWRFPARNRIIAGLADAVVVVESRSAGGSMSTVAEALTRDRPVLAVPGHPTSPAAAGTLDLIYDGATPVRDAHDVLVALELVGVRAPASPPVAPLLPVEVDEGWEAAVLAELTGGPRSLGDLVQRLGAPLDDLSEVLLRLELEGELTRSGTWFERRSTQRGSAVGRRR